MSIFRINRMLAEQIQIMEDDCADRGGKWITINGASVCISGKPGKKADVVFGPGSLKNPEKEDPNTKRLRDEKGRYQKAKKTVDDVLGPDTPFNVSENDKGEPEFGHPDVKEKVTLGKTVGDAVGGMLSFVDIIASAAARASGRLADSLANATSDLMDALEQWQQGGR